MESFKAGEEGAFKVTKGEVTEGLQGKFLGYPWGEKIKGGRKREKRRDF